MDITNPKHIRALATRVQGDPQGRAVRALVNNAAIAVNDGRGLRDRRVATLFEVDLFGHIAVTQTLLPALNPQQGSRDQHQLRGSPSWLASCPTGYSTASLPPLCVRAFPMGPLHTTWTENALFVDLSRLRKMPVK